MSRVVVCAVLAACTTPLEVEKLPPPGPPPTADSIVAEMLATYTSMTSYVDRGLVSEVLVKAGAPAQKVDFEFQTAFDRPKLRFDAFVDEVTERYAIWSDGSTTRSAWAVRPGRIDQHDSIGVALGAAAGVSGFTSVMIPGLLTRTQSPLQALERPAVAGSEDVDHVPCWRIDAHLHDRSTSVWIDKHAHLVRRIVITSRVDTKEGAFDSTETITYVPVVKGAVAVTPIDTTGKTIVDNRTPTWIGIRFDGTTTRITQVITKGPAERAGLAIDDEIVSVNGDAVAKSSDVITRVRATKPGGRVALRVQRHGAPLDISLAAEVMPDVDKLTHDALIDRPAPDFSLPVVNAVGSATLADLAKDIVVVDFWATWCKPCEIARPHLNEIQAKHAGKLHVLAISAKDIVVVDFWATWCKPCEIARPHLNEIQAKHRGKLHVVAISNEDLKDITDYVASHDMKFTVAHDPDGKVWSSYIVGGLPTTVVIAKGRIRYVGVGVDDAALDDAVAKALVQ